MCLVGLTLFIRDTYMFCLMVQLSVHQWQKKVMSASSAANRKFCVLFCSAKEIEFGSWTNRHKSMIWKSQMAFLSYAEGCKGLEGAGGSSRALFPGYIIQNCTDQSFDFQHYANQGLKRLKGFKLPTHCTEVKSSNPLRYVGFTDLLVFVKALTFSLS